MIMLDTVDFPIGVPGAIRAGIVPVPLNTLLTSDQYAYMLADCRARVLFVSEALLPVVKDIVGRMPDLEYVIVSGKDAHGHKKFPTTRARERCVRDGRDPCRRAGLLALFVGLDRHAEGREAFAFQSCRDRRYLCQAGARHPRGRCLSLGGETVLRLWPRQCADVSDVGRRHHGAQCGSSDAGADVRAVEQIQADHLLSACRRCSRRCFNDEALEDERCGRACASAPRPARLCRSMSATAWKTRFGVDILDGVGSTEMLHIFLSNAPGDIKYGTSGHPVPGYEVRLVNEAGGDVPTAKSARCWCDAPSAGEGYWNQRSKSRADLRGPLDPHRRQIYPRCRRPLHLLRPQRRHVQGLRHLGLAVRGRERADHPSRGAGGGGGARSRSGRAVEAEGVRGAASGCEEMAWTRR